MWNLFSETTHGPGLLGHYREWVARQDCCQKDTVKRWKAESENGASVRHEQQQDDIVYYKQILEGRSKTSHFN